MTINGLNTGNTISYYDYSKINAKTESNTTSTTQTTDTYTISDEAKASQEVESTEEGFVNNTGYPDELIKMLYEEAKKDAHKGDYMSSKASQSIIQYAEKTAGPDRASLMMQMTPYIKPSAGTYLPNMLSLLNGFTANLNYGTKDEALFVYNPAGEKVLTYSHRDGMWTTDHTKAETDEMSTIMHIYKDAFDAERSVMHENGIKDSSGKVPTDPYTFT
ncbi:MAG: hypothetical protein R3Y63_14730 [Eubacteriales bacterium]